VAASVFLACSVAFASAAHASPDTLRLALEDLIIGSVDVAAAPVTAGVATVQNLPEVSDNGFLQALYVVPGWIGLTFLQSTQAVLRVAVGGLELIPGILLFPIPGVDVPESWNVFRRQDPLVEFYNPLADDPSWLAYGLPITPFTIDVRMAPISPWALYDSPPDSEMSGAAE
jgi:hypothetical protein